MNRRRTAYETVLERLQSTPQISTPGRTRTCDRLHVREVPLPLGHGGVRNCRLQIADCKMRNAFESAICNLQSAMIRAGRSRTCLPPRIRRLPGRSATARSAAPCTGLEPVSPARQTGRHTRCVTGQARVSGGSRTRLSTLAGGASAAARPRNTVSKGGRSRTLCVRGWKPHCSPRSTSLVDQRKGQDSNLQGLAPRPASNRVPSCLLARPSVSAAPAGLEPAPVWLTASRTTVVLQGKISSGGWGRTSGLLGFQAAAALTSSELHRNRQRRRQESNLLQSRVAADRLAVRPRRHLRHQEPAVGLEPTWSALRGRCPARRASPALSALSACHLVTSSPFDLVTTGWIAGYDPAPRRSQGRVQSHYTISTIKSPKQYPREESNLTLDLRRVACRPAHSEDVRQYPGQESNLDLLLRREP